jgi:type IV secretion system protein VirB10
MSQPDTPLPNPERFELRGRPRPVTRINRRLVFFVVIAAGFVVAALFVFALRQTRWSARETSELLNTEAKPYAPGLDALPKRYDAVQPPALPEAPPIKRPQLPSPALPEQAASVDNQEAALLSRQARSAGVFFQLRATASPAKTARNVSQRSHGLQRHAWQSPAQKNIPGSAADGTRPIH